MDGVKLQWSFKGLLNLLASKSFWKKGVKTFGCISEGVAMCKSMRGLFMHNYILFMHCLCNILCLLQ